jgi:hypothetical protein
MSETTADQPEGFLGDHSAALAANSGANRTIRPFVRRLFPGTDCPENASFSAALWTELDQRLRATADMPQEQVVSNLRAELDAGHCANNRLQDCFPGYELRARQEAAADAQRLTKVGHYGLGDHITYAGSRTQGLANWATTGLQKLRGSDTITESLSEAANTLNPGRNA